MTNQNVIAPNLKSQINSVIAVLMSIPNSPVLPGAGVPESMAVLREFLKGTSQKKLMKRTNDGEGKGGAKVTSWIDSMRASSPPRVRTTVHNCENLDLHHPSALNVFDQIIHKARGKKIISFLDYDGTLSPIVADPEKAYMTEKMRETVKDIARHFPTAIVTGRCIDTVYNFVRLAELYYAGSHGMDIKGPTKTKNSEKGKQDVLFQPASQFLPMINEVNKILVEKTKSFSGAMVENNKFCLSVHYRCVEEKSWGALAEKVRSVLNDYPKLKLTQGRKVLEIRPNIKWDKGKALEFLLRSLGYAKSQDVFPIYIGDDRTDEDAFKVLRNRGQGIGILVSKAPRETDASYTLQDPTEVEQFLRRLVEWKRRRVNPITSVETCRL